MVLLTPLKTQAFTAVLQLTASILPSWDLVSAEENLSVKGHTLPRMARFYRQLHSYKIPAFLIQPKTVWHSNPISELPVTLDEDFVVTTLQSNFFPA